MVGQDEFRSHFDGMSEIKNINFFTPSFNPSITRAWISFHTEEACTQYLESLENKTVTISGQNISVDFSKPKEKLTLENTPTLYVRNISFNTSETDLCDIFTPYGSLSYCRIIKHPDGRPRGFGFVRYDDYEHANEAMKQLNGMELDGRQIFINKSMPRKKPQQERRPAYQQEVRDDFW